MVAYQHDGLVRPEKGRASINFLALLIPFLCIWLGLSVQGFSDQSADLLTDKPEDEEKPFRRSELIGSPTKMREGDVIEYTLIVRYGGPEDPMQVSIYFSLKASPVMFVSSSPEMVLIEDERKLEWSGVISPGKELIFTIKLVTLPDSASNRSLQSSAGIYWRGALSGKYWQGGSQWVESNETEIHSKLTAGTGNVKIIALGYLIGGPLITICIPWIILRRKKKRRPFASEKVETASAEIIVLGVMSFFFFLDVRSCPSHGLHRY